MAKAEVLADGIRWKDGDATFDADKGDTVDLPTDELKRLVDLGAVKAKSGSSSAPDPWKDVTVESLDKYAGQHQDAFTDYDDKAKKADKVKAFEAAGVTAETVAEFALTSEP